MPQPFDILAYNQNQAKFIEKLCLPLFTELKVLVRYFDKEVNHLNENRDRFEKNATDFHKHH